jgi:enterochelin esterase-like enzyme
MTTSAYITALRFICLVSVVLLSFAAPLYPLQPSTYTLQVTARYPASKLPQSQALFLRGDSCGLSWSQGVLLNKLSTQADTWYVVLDCETAAADIVSMKVLVDDSTWSLGCNMHAAAGAREAVLFPWFYSTAGHYEYIRSVYSPQLKNWRDVVVYLPPSYSENTLKGISNMLVMHDGQNLFNESTSAFGCWHCDHTADANIIAGSVEELAIIGVDNSDDRTNELTYSYDASQQSGGKGNAYLDFIEQTVLEAVRSRFRVSDAATVAMGGSSLGGLLTCYAAATRPTVWASAACMSSSFWYVRALCSALDFRQPNAGGTLKILSAACCPRTLRRQAAACTSTAAILDLQKTTRRRRRLYTPRCRRRGRALRIILTLAGSTTKSIGGLASGGRCSSCFLQHRRRRTRESGAQHAQFSNPQASQCVQ